MRQLPDTRSADSEGSLRSSRKANLRRLLAPRHVALVGGRSNVAAIAMLRASGFEGEIWPVHPTHSNLAGLPVYPSPDDLPEAPDAVFLNISSRATPEVVARLAARGAGGAICYSAGYAELGEAGRTAQEDLVTAAGQMALVGPNSNGLLNALDGLALWPVESHKPQRRERGAAILSSSGGVLFNYAINQRSVPAAVMVGVGNQAVLDFPCYIETLATDPRITAIGLFAEDIGDPVRFGQAALLAAERGVPVVALKSGRTARSAQLAATHSGAMIAPDDMIDALFERCGVVRVRTLPELDETLKMLTLTTRPKGRRTAALTILGGEKALILDASEGLAMEFAEPSPEARSELEKQIPDYASVSNPFDFNPYYSGENVLAMDNRASLERCFETVLKDDYDIGVLMVSIRTPEEPTADMRRNLYSTTIEAFSTVCTRLGISGVVASAMPEHLPVEVRADLAAKGVAPLMGLEEMLRAIDNTIRWKERASILREGGGDQPEDPVHPGDHLLWDESAAKAALAALGVPVPPSRAVAPAEAAGAGEALGFPVVLKVLDPVFAHKAAAGGVMLSLNSASEVEEATETMAERLARDGHVLRRVLVERMVPEANFELIVGIKHEPGFGHALVLGRGGADVELFLRPPVLLLPSQENVLERYVLDSPALDGQPVALRLKVLEAVKAVIAFRNEHRAILRGLDINPLIVDRRGEVMAVDALVEMTDV